LKKIIKKIFEKGLEVSDLYKFSWKQNMKANLQVVLLMSNQHSDFKK